jgi:hypothetical protein
MQYHSSPLLLLLRTQVSKLSEHSVQTQQFRVFLFIFSLSMPSAILETQDFVFLVFARLKQNYNKIRQTDLGTACTCSITPPPPLEKGQTEEISKLPSSFSDQLQLVKGRQH